MKIKGIYVLIFVLMLGLPFISGCKKSENEVQTYSAEKKQLDKRISQAVIYEVNIRQYTPEGTFRAFEKHLPRLKQLGVDVIWLMPIYPIGEKNRKGTLGSYYSVKDYYGVNPEYGTKQDLKHLIDQAHENGMLVILDWVANHTAWDNPWVKKHPDWYVHNPDGTLHSPFDWTDVVKLDYNNMQMRKAMINAMKYWVENFDIDGFRCDVAGEVPTDFWDSARVELEKVKPLFMLAEAEKPDLMYSAFDAYYGWHLLYIMNQISQGKMDARELKKYFNGHAKEFPARAMRMNFTSNHDENSWNGTVFERMPHSYKTFAVFTYIVPDIPLIYSGQEACLNKRLRFFDKDTIEWKDCDMFGLYQKLNSLRHTHPALAGGPDRGKMKILRTSDSVHVFALARYKDNDTIVALFNLSGDTVNVKLRFARPAGQFKEYFSDTEAELKRGSMVSLKPWDYKVFIKK